MKLSKVFRNASRAIELGKNVYCCTAIDDATWFGDPDRLPALYYFNDLFKPTRNRTYWWPQHDRDSRVVALCFAAAIAESEGK